MNLVNSCINVYVSSSSSFSLVRRVGLESLRVSSSLLLCTKKRDGRQHFYFFRFLSMISFTLEDKE